MANLTYTTTPQEDAGIQQALILYNAQLAAQVPPLPPLTALQYVQQVVLAPAFASYVRQRTDAKTGDVGAAYRAADAATQQKVRTDLGIGTPP